MKDFYYILGTDENCTTPEIKEAYRKLSKKFHPDLNFNDKYFEKHFREIKEAYETLIDPDKRSVYDKKLHKFKADPAYDQYAEDLKHREEELRRREEKIRFRQAYPHYYRSRKAPGQDKDSAAPITPGTRSRIRKVDMVFTLVLVAITIIFGNYVMRVVHDEKPAKIVNNNAPVVADVPFQPVKHKRKHKLKAILSDTPVATNNQTPAAKVIADDYKSAVAETKAEEKAQAQKPPVVIDDDNNSPSSPDNTPDQPVAVSYKPQVTGNKFLYATNIISNATGITNLRKTDHYNSDIIKEIPSNSKVLVIQKGDVFYKVLCNNSTGYVPKWALETK